jgi:CoA:oxalate CoA-transferase
MAKAALEGVRVIEYCEMVAGPFCTRLLSDLGAEVIKVEAPGTGDPTRQRGPYPGDLPHPEKSGLFLCLNMNKKSITLNPGVETGREILTKLLKRADIFVEDKTPAIMKRFALDYENLKRVNPHLIVVSITPFGQTGLHRDYKMYPLNTFHSGGEGYLLPPGSQYLNREPIKAGRFVGEYDVGLSTAIATVAALYARGVTGEGQYVDVSKQEALIALERVQIARYGNEGFVGKRDTVKHRGGAGIMSCKDGYVIAELLMEHQWQAFVKFMGNPEWVKDERFKDEDARYEHQDVLNQLIQGWMKEHTKDEIYHGGQAKGCPTSPLCTAEDLLNSEQLRERGFFVEFSHPVAGKLKYPSVPYQMSKTPIMERRAAPLLGQDNEEIYTALGYSRQELVKMRQAGII